MYFDALTFALIGAVVALVGITAKALDSKVFDLGDLSPRLKAYPATAEFLGLALTLGSLAYEAVKEMGIGWAVLAIVVTLVLVVALAFPLVFAGAGLSHLALNRSRTRSQTEQGQPRPAVTGDSDTCYPRCPSHCC